MEKIIFDFIIIQGAFAVLFVWILFDSRKNSKEREIKYQNIINSLSERIGEIKDIKEDVQNIKIKLKIK